MFLINDVPIDCINEAAIEYHVPAAMIISILKTENGRVGDANINRDHSIDYGPMQINSRWVGSLKNNGINVKDLQYNACKNVQVGTWILAQNIASEDNPWKGVGDYHSHTLSKNVYYQQLVSHTFYKLNAALTT